MIFYKYNFKESLSIKLSFRGKVKLIFLNRKYYYMEDLILLHGAIGSKEQLKLLEESLSDKFRVHNFNFSGHGGNQMSEKFSIENFAKEVLEYMDLKQIGSANIFGYSMGGYVALYLAKNHLDKVKKVFTLGTKFLWTPEIADREIKMLNANKITEKLPAFAKALENRHQPNDWKIVLQETSDMMIELGNKNVLEQEDFKEIKQAVTIAIGDKDNMVTLEETIDVYRRLSKANLIVFPNTQHSIEKVDLKKLSDEIADFFISPTL
jgi:esterase/lipase